MAQLTGLGTQQQPALPLPENRPQTRDPSTYCLDNARLDRHTSRISAKLPKPVLISWRSPRLGEAAAVQLGDVDFVRASLTVTRQVQRVNGGAIDVRAPKCGSERIVHLADGLVDLLAQHVADFGALGDEQWLFTGEGDEPPHQNTVGYWWRKNLLAAGLSDIKLHDLRHFYASGLIVAGCDVVTVQRSLSHAKATTTLNTYAHLWPTAEDRTRMAAQSIMDASLDRVVPIPGKLVSATQLTDEQKVLVVGQVRSRLTRHHDLHLLLGS